MKLRPYQLEAKAAAIRQLTEAEGVKSTLIVLPTGCGKTVIFSSVIHDFPAHGRWMVLAHREELIRQAAEKIHRVTGEHPEIEMANERADSHMFRRTRAVVGTVQTLSSARKERFDWTKFRGIIIDEAHHAVSPSYQDVIAHARAVNPNILVLGVTATPDRADRVALGKVFDSVAYVYELTNAINDGFLVPINARAVEVHGLDFTKLRTVNGDLAAGELAELVEREQNLHRIARPALDLVKWRKALVFAVSVKQAEALAEIMNRYRRNSARWFSGKTPRDERRDILADFAEGRFQFLINVGVLTEGYDEPTIDMVIMARPTKSRALYSQMIGRGTRPLTGVIDGLDTPEERLDAINNSDKPNVEVVDFVGVCGQHRLMTAADILGGDDEAVIDRANAAIRAKNGVANVSEELRKAERDIHAEKAAEAARRQHVVAETSEYTVSELNPFDVFGMDPPRKAWRDAPPPTERMLGLLAKNGIDATGLDMAQAGKLCGEVIARFREGKCTFKQAKMLAAHGHPTDVSKAEASRLIDSIIAAKKAPKPRPKPIGAPA